jgi:LacI family transcriptional regulator
LHFYETHVIRFIHDQIMRKATDKSETPPPNRARTMRDVAHAADVGIATVSRVLNNSSLVVPETAARVRRIMAELGYRLTPSEKRRGKANHSTPSLKHRAVCVLFTEQQSLRWMIDCAPVYAYAIHGAEAALNSRGISCIIHHVSTPADINGLKDLEVDGFLLFGGDKWNSLPGELAKFPGVKMLGVPVTDWCDRVTYNSDTIGNLAADYLYSRGIRHTAVIGTSKGGVFSRRVLSFSRSITNLGGTVVNLLSDEIIRVLPDSNAPVQEIVSALVGQLLQSSPKPEGIFITSDVITPAVYRELERRGIAPGKDIVIVSCNNEKPYLASLNPKSAVVDIQAEAIGSQAVERLLWRIEHPTAPKATLLMEPILVRAPEAQDTPP